jgi:hypothetical protein
MAGRYSLSAYDDYFCIKPPLLLWLAVLYLSRAVTVPIVAAVGGFAGVSSDAIALLKSSWSLEGLGPSVAAALVLYAMIRRSPTAPRFVRRVSMHGRLVLAVSAVLDLALSGFLLASQSVQPGHMPPGLITAGADIYFLLYVLLARRVRDTFSDFPAVVAH